MPAVGSNHAQRVLSSLNQQRAVGRFCDAVLKVGDTGLFLAHHNILACFSELFEQSKTSPVMCTEFSLQDCPDDGLELLLNFIYTGELKLDLDNLDKVQQAAAILCVPEALALCQHFRDAPVNFEPLKRKRGRPRRCGSDVKAVKEENLPIVTTDLSSFKMTVPSCTTAATTTLPTTTRSGRVVKGPKRLVTADVTSDSDSVRAVFSNVEKKTVAEEHPNPDHPTLETKVKCINMWAKKALKQGVSTYPHSDFTALVSCYVQVPEQQTGISDSVGSKVARETAAEEEEEEEDDADNSEGVEDTDEEYVPTAEPTSSALPEVTTQNHKAESKPNKNKNSDSTEEDSKKNFVQCPICHKSFKSKYYLKVHNRYTVFPFLFPPGTVVKRVTTDVCLLQAAYRGEAIWLP